MPEQEWDAGLYSHKHSFVTAYGEDLLTLLAPAPGERILDMGCGTGALSAQIAAAGAHVTGLDSSPGMIAAATAACPGIEFIQADIARFRAANQYDAVFSNAVLHWVTAAADAARAIAGALKPGGRFVAEFGGKGNILGITTAVEDVLSELTGRRLPHAWYFPSIAEYGTVLESNGFEVSAAWLFDRWTKLDGPEGMRNWLRMFGGGMFQSVDPELRERAIPLIEARLAPTHCVEGVWHADYRRLRVVAKRT